jgi:hypothetical protein
MAIAAKAAKPPEPPDGQIRALASEHLAARLFLMGLHTREDVVEGPDSLEGSVATTDLVA